LIAIDPSTVQTGLAEAQKAGALSIGADNGGVSPNPTVTPPTGDIWPVIDVSVNYAALARSTAKWIIQNSKGKANILVYGDKEYPVITEGVAALVSTLKTCKTCRISPVQYFVANDIATTVGPNVVSYLRTHPKVNYVYAPYDPSAPAMVTAIQNAGMSKRVKVVSYLGDQQNLTYILEGEIQVADGAVDNTYNGWAVVDQAIRYMDKLPFAKPLNENVPYELLTKSNVGISATLSTGWVAPYNYISKFESLWK
jgi:ABC-type sugar transport system substrate-binding protein